jgi:flagellar biogenesis protein FliO
MDANTSSTPGRSCGRLFWLAVTIGWCSFALPVTIPAVHAVGADSSIYANPATPSLPSTKGVVSGSLPTTVGDSLPLPAETPQPLPGFFSTFLRLILALGLTIGLIYLTVWGLKVLWEKKGFTGVSESGKPVRILASVYLAPRKSIQLVEVGRRILVVGSGNEEVHPLDVITDPEEIEAIRKECQQGFPEVFGRFMHRQEVRDHAVEARKIVSEGRQAVGDYLARVRKASKSVDKKDGEEKS